jgi:hypothetical protein
MSGTSLLPSHIEIHRRLEPNTDMTFARRSVAAKGCALLVTESGAVTKPVCCTLCQLLLVALSASTVAPAFPRVFTYRTSCVEPRVLS